SVAISGTAFAKGSGGGHGGGHGSGGHGGHSSRGHASGGHRSGRMGGHASRRTSGGQAAGPKTTSPATTVAGPPGFPPAHLGDTLLGTAILRLSSISSSIVGSGSFLPSRGVPYYGPELGFRGLYYNPCWLHSYAHPAFGYGYRASVNEGD